jgi:hypothetical protein
VTSKVQKTRGITVTPTFSKIMEKIIKIRENPTIMKIQNPLQRGFTENSAPLLCELFIEEYDILFFHLIHELAFV